MGEPYYAFSFRFHFVLSKLKALRDENSSTGRIPIHSALAQIALQFVVRARCMSTHRTINYIYSRNRIHVFEIINRRIFVFPGLILKINIVEERVCLCVVFLLSEEKTPWSV